jgi:mannose-6-phosphate isomerase-like protein (cupin superfamily)
MPNVIRIEKTKSKLSKPFFKRPIARVDGYYMGIARLEGEHKLHYHDMDELVYVLDGQLIIKVNNRKYTLETGEGILIKAGERHITLCEKETHILVFESQNVSFNEIRE